MNKKKILATLVMLSLMQGHVYALELTGQKLSNPDSYDLPEVFDEFVNVTGTLYVGNDEMHPDDNPPIKYTFNEGVVFNGDSIEALRMGIYSLDHMWNQIPQGGILDLTIGNGKTFTMNGPARVWYNSQFTLNGDNADIVFNGNSNNDAALQVAENQSFMKVNAGSMHINNIGTGLRTSNTSSFDFTLSKDFVIDVNGYGIYHSGHIDYGLGYEKKSVDSKIVADNIIIEAGQRGISLNTQDNVAAQLGASKFTFTANEKIDIDSGLNGLYSYGQNIIELDANNIDINSSGSYALIVSNNGDFTTKNTKELVITSGKDEEGKQYASARVINSKAVLDADVIRLTGQLDSIDGGNIKAISDDLTLYSENTDALYSVSDTDEKSVIDIETSAIISNQGNETDYADSNDSTYAALHALRNSEINLKTEGKQYKIYGNVLAGRGVSSTDAEHGGDEGGVITIGGSGTVIKGDVFAGNSGKVDITLNDGLLDGRVDGYSDASLGVIFRPVEFGGVDVDEAGTVTLNMGTNSTWDVRGQSYITNLNFMDNAQNAVVDLTQNDEFSSVTIDNLSGSGTFNMRLNSADHSKGDMLYIVNGSGKHMINIADGITGGLENISEKNPLRFATVKNSNGTLDIGNEVAAYTRDAGFRNLSYEVKKVDFDPTAEKDNIEYNGEDDGEGVHKPGNNFVENVLDEDKKAVNWVITGIKEGGSTTDPDVPVTEVSDAGKTIINMSKVNYNNAIYMDRLNKRMGEARYINPEDEQGMWVRIRHDRIGKDDAFRSQNTMYEMGYDEKQECDNGERRVGFAVDYMDGKAEYTGIAGDGDVKRYGLWLYDTWMGDKGHYADYVAKWGHLENDFDIMARSTGEKINGDYSNNVFSVSAEYGRKKDIGNDWYVEPQAQLQLARVTGADYTTSQGTRVSLDGINSLIGRAGFRLGRDVDERSTVYVKADLLHEFLGEQDMHVVDNTFNGSQTFENKGTWYDVGFGFATALGKDSYAFMDFEKSFGNDNDETYQINAGVQWTF